jgi:Leucine-rich repeat (LRR) protein
MNPDFGARSASVEQLYFSHNNLTKITKESLDKFTNITILEINDNLISDIVSVLLLTDYLWDINVLKREDS